MKRNCDALSDTTFDVVVVGAGIYGALCAWDAVLRGLSVALIDKGDFGGATSSNSLKIVHGGLRYLQQLDIPRFRESVRERCIWMRIAPHLVHPLPCVMPTYGHLMKGKEVMRIGLLLNDVLGFDRNRLDDREKIIPNGKVIGKKECLRLTPFVDGKRVTGGAFWIDAQMADSERLLLSVVLSAAGRGAQAANHVQAKEFLVRNGRVEGVRAEDRLSGKSLDIRGRVVLNTVGGWTDELLGSGGIAGSGKALSTAMNLVLSRNILPECAAGVYGDFEYPLPKGGSHQGRRVLFMTPWRNRTIVGTFHRAYPGKPDDLGVREQEIEECLKEITAAAPGEKIRREDVVFVHKGFLPMDGIHGKTGEVILTKHYRIIDHARQGGPKGLISVIGVKYTTSRDVARRAVDRVLLALEKSPARCETHSLPLAGGAVPDFKGYLDDALGRWSSRYSPEIVRRLVIRYGSDLPSLLALAEKQPDLGKTVPGSKEVLYAELEQAIRSEMAVTLSDLVFRRTDLGSAGTPARDTIEACGRFMAKSSGWSEARLKTEIAELAPLAKIRP